MVTNRSADSQAIYGGGWPCLRVRLYGKLCEAATPALGKDMGGLEKPGSGIVCPFSTEKGLIKNKKPHI